MNLKLAQTIIQKALEIAKKRNLEIAIAVTDEHGETTCFARTDRSSYHAGVLAVNKAYTAARDRQVTRNLGDWAKETGKSMGFWTDSRFTGIAGGVPIVVGKQIVGAVGISGLSEDEDENMVFEIIDSTLINQAAVLY